MRERGDPQVPQRSEDTELGLQIPATNIAPGLPVEPDLCPPPQRSLGTGHQTGPAEAVNRHQEGKAGTPQYGLKTPVASIRASSW